MKHFGISKVNLQECRCTAYLAESAERESLFTVMQMETVQEEVEEKIHAFMEQGFRYIRCHMGTYGGNFDGTIQNMVHPENAPKGAYYSSRTYMQSVVKLFDRIRTDIGWNLEIMHDIHERLSLADTLSFTKELEQFKPFFIEDALAPDQVGYFKYLREQTAVPLAMGELFTHPLEWKTIVQNQWIDFIRCHLSDIGGLTPARKVAAFCEQYQVRTAWHGPNRSFSDWYGSTDASGSLQPELRYSGVCRI